MAFVSPTPVSAARASRSPTVAPRHRRAAPAQPASRPPPPRMVATEPATTQLTRKARELLSYVRGHKSIFHPGLGFNATHCALFRKNDTGRLFTPLEELATNAHMLPGGSVAALVVVQEEQLLETACSAVYAKFPDLEQDDTLVEILSFDLRYLLRVISYGAACQATDFIHRNNMGMMKMLHQEIALPAGADVVGLKAAKDAVLAQVESHLVEKTADCFDVVTEMLS